MFSDLVQMQEPTTCLRGAPFVAVVKTTNSRSYDDRFSGCLRGRSAIGRVFLKCEVRSASVIVPEVGCENAPKMRLIQNDHVIEALPGGSSRSRARTESNLSRLTRDLLRNEQGSRRVPNGPSPGDTRHKHTVRSSDSQDPPKVTMTLMMVNELSNLWKTACPPSTSVASHESDQFG